MKQLSVTIVIVLITLCSFAQQREDDQRGWRRENLFIGTGINLGFFNGFVIGLNPEVGYSLNKVIDAGVSTNLSYISQNDLYSPTTYRQTVVGGGPFVRIWPARMLFVGSQFEYNSINYSIRTSNNVSFTDKRSAPSLLVGIGYGSRNVGASQFYTSVYVDVLKNANSPYIDQFNRMLPVIRTAFIFYLRPKQ
ncbi:MAG TPA: hypothetical protein VFV46_09215 [Lacibacter sp.]|nr:hypothetical protein [Lacibacter sp.]